SFDQRIDLLSVIAKTRVQASGRDWKVRLASAHEIQADKSVLELSKRAQAGRWLAFTITADRNGQRAGGATTARNSPARNDCRCPNKSGPRFARRTQSNRTRDRVLIYDRGCAED